MKIISTLSLCLLVGCCPPIVPSDPAADRPIYKPYTVDVPPRPTLTTTDDIKSEGELVRAVETDLSLLAEYAQKLENLIKALPKTLSIPASQ